MHNKFKITGHKELDAIRFAIIVEQKETTRENYEVRLFLLKQWLCTLQQMGVDTVSFLDISEVFKMNFPWNLYEFQEESPSLCEKSMVAVCKAVDDGYWLLDQLYNNTSQLTSHPTLVPQSRKINQPCKVTEIIQEQLDIQWPLYQGDPQHTGVAQTQNVLHGNKRWRFPLSLGWESSVVIENQQVYAASPGMRTMCYCFDAKTGEEVWSTKQLPSIVVDQLYWTPCASSTPCVVGSEIFLRTMGSRGNVGDTKYTVVIDKESGAITRQIETGHVDYRAGHAPLATNHTHMVYPYGVHDIEQSPPVAQPFNRLVCKDCTDGMVQWVFPVGPTLCTPVMDEDIAITGTMEGLLVCLNIDTSLAREHVCRWQFQASGAINATPVIYKNFIFFGDNCGTMYCLSKHDGSLVWEYSVEHVERKALRHFSVPFVKDGKVYIGSANTFLYCFDQKSGELLWKHKHDDWIRSRPVVINNMVFSVTITGMLTCFKEIDDTVKPIWKKSISTHDVYANMNFSDNHLYISTSDLFLFCYDVQGSLVWKQSLIPCAYDGIHKIFLEQIAGGAYFQSKVTAANGKIFFGAPSGFLYAVDSQTGKEWWRFEMGGAISAAPAYQDSKIFVGQQGGEEYFYCIDAKTGEKIWQQSIGWTWGSCNISDNKVFVASIDGYANCLDTRSGAILWRYRTNQSLCSEPAVQGSTVFFGSWDHYMYAFDIHSGSLVWRKYFASGADSGSQVAVDELLYMPAPGSKFRCLESSSGKTIWELCIEKSNFNVTPAYHNNRLYLSAMIGRCLGGISVSCNVYCVDTETRKILWTHQGGGHTAPLVAGDRVYVGSLTSPYVYCLDTEGNNDGTVNCYWKFRMGNRVEEACCAWYQSHLYVLSSDGYVYALE